MTGIIDEEHGPDTDVDVGIVAGGACDFTNGLTSYSMEGTFIGTAAGAFSGAGSMKWHPTDNLDDPHLGQFFGTTDYSISLAANSNGTYSLGFNLNASASGAQTTASLNTSYSSDQFTASAGLDEYYTSGNTTYSMSVSVNSSGNFTVYVGITWHN